MPRVMGAPMRAKPVVQQPHPLHAWHGNQSHELFEQNCHLPAPQHWKFEPFFHSHELPLFSLQAPHEHCWLHVCCEHGSQLAGLVSPGAHSPSPLHADHPPHVHCAVHVRA